MPEDQMARSRWETIKAHLEHDLHTEVPDFWVKLAHHAPWVMEGYDLMRERTFLDSTEGGALPKKFKELVVVAMDILQNNVWGIRAHVRSAVLEGATMDEVTEVVALTILSRGMVGYRMGGYDALIAAEEAVKERESQGR